MNYLDAPSYDNNYGLAQKIRNIGTLVKSHEGEDFEGEDFYEFADYLASQVEKYEEPLNSSNFEEFFNNTFWIGVEKCFGDRYTSLHKKDLRNIYVDWCRKFKLVFGSIELASDEIYRLLGVGSKGSDHTSWEQAQALFEEKSPNYDFVFRLRNAQVYVKGMGEDFYFFCECLADLVLQIEDSLDNDNFTYFMDSVFQDIVKKVFKGKKKQRKIGKNFYIWLDKILDILNYKNEDIGDVTPEEALMVSGEGPVDSVGGYDIDNQGADKILSGFNFSKLGSVCDLIMNDSFDFYEFVRELDGFISSTISQYGLQYLASDNRFFLNRDSKSEVIFNACLEFVDGFASDMLSKRNDPVYRNIVKMFSYVFMSYVTNDEIQSLINAKSQLSREAIKKKVCTRMKDWFGKIIDVMKVSDFQDTGNLGLQNMTDEDIRKAFMPDDEK